MKTTRKLKDLSATNKPLNDTATDTPVVYNYEGKIGFWRMTGAIVTAWTIITILPTLLIVTAIIALAYKIH